jgi:predicted alpha/beta hydrolase family esterase
MVTIILPGYSLYNKVWAEGIAKELEEKVLPTIVHEWRHWKKKSISLSISKEIEKIKEEIGDSELNILAKSVGVYVALNLIPKIPKQVNKAILCGIASVEGEERAALLKEVLEVVPYENILCIQNESDKFVKYPDALSFYHSIEPKLKVVSKPRSDHDYPYPTDFVEFFKSDSN